MHLKSCPKLVRSELRLDLGQQQGALLRRNQNNRLPLAALSTNTLRCSPHGGAVRAKGTENSGFTEEEGSALDVWNVIKPGHVKEKIALFAHETGTDRNAKGSWDVTVKRRRRSSQIQSLQSPQVQLRPQPPVTLEPPAVPQIQPQTAKIQPQTPHIQPQTLQTLQTLQTAQDCSEDEAKLSVVEMVAFLEQRVTCTPHHAKLRSSASITLSRAPPLSPPAPAPPPDRPVAAEGEEPESVSVSDMVAKLESQCLRRRSQGERRTVGRVLLAEQNHAPLTGPQPISTSEKLKAAPTSNSSLETRKTSISFCKSDLKVTTNVMPCFSMESRGVSKATQATPTSSERSNAIGRGKMESPPSSQPTEAQSKTLPLCKSDRTLQAKPNSMQRCDAKEMQKSAANSVAILSSDIFTKVETKTLTSEVASAKFIQVEKVVTTLTSSDVIKPENVLETEATPPLQLQATPSSSSKSVKSLESPSYEEPMPGLLFLTPPSKPSVQSEKRKPLTPASLFVSSPNSNSDSFLILSTSDFAVQSEKRKTTEQQQSPGSSSNSDSFVILSLDLTVQSQTRTRCSFSLSPASSSSSELKLKMVNSPDSDSLPASDQSEKRKRQPCSLSPASNPDSSPIRTLKPSSSNDLIVQSEKRKSCPVTKSDSGLSRSSLDLVVQSEKSTLSSTQSERTYFTITNASQSEKSSRGASSESLLPETSSDLSVQSEKRKPCLSKSENRKSCPVTESDFSVQSETRILVAKRELLPLESQSEKRRLNRIAQSEKRKSCPVPDSDSLEFTVQSEKRKSCPVNDSDWANSDHIGQSEKRKPGLVANFALSDSALENQSEKRKSCPVTDSDLGVQSEARIPASGSALCRSSSDAGSVLLRSSSDVGSERRKRRKAVRAFSLCSAVAPERYRAASEDFLLMRRRVQRLLEPRSQVSYLSLLPHHLLVHILLLLPTRALAALKCTCHYFRLIIDTYAVRPADSLWVCDPRYRDDPCKQCKRRYQRGDVSLCRWHHKPFCQAMPYGPGYWMCCHGDRRDAPGCNVGLHDNRWVPAFHSINAPIYRQGRHREEQEDG